MPYGRYPSRVKSFQKWAAGLVQGAELTGSATPGKVVSVTRRRKRRKKRRSLRRRSRRKRHA